MAAIPTYFSDFLSSIRLTAEQTNELKLAHTTLRAELEADPDLSGIIVSTFLQGSYRRSTAIRPVDDSHPDVDIIVVTSLDKDKVSPQEAMNKFIPFLNKHYNGKYRLQGRSIGITLDHVDLDVVPTSAPSETIQQLYKQSDIRSDKSILDFELELSHQSADWRHSMFHANSVFPSLSINQYAKWRDEPLWIPDRENSKWERTHPLAQIEWTKTKNKNCNSHYVNVVKAIKWWHKRKHAEQKQPKSYPLEHFIGDCCSDGIENVAEGVVNAFETIRDQYRTKPFLPDRGVPEHDVFKRLSYDEYDRFYEAICAISQKARKALDEPDINKSVALWYDVFGDPFPKPDEGMDGDLKRGFSPRTEKADNVPAGRFA